MAQDDEIRQEDAEYLEAEALPSSDNAEDVKAEEMKTAGTGGEQPQEAGHIDTDGSIPVPDKENMEAVGITYDSDSSSSPVISSIGKGERAEAIVEMAKSLGIYVHRDPQLLNELKRLEEGEEVPKELFVIIATILSFSYLLQGKTPDVYTRADGTKAVNAKA